jgi:hypothetical protein
MTSTDNRRTMVMQWETSGLTAAEFGGRGGVSKQQLHHLAYRLGLTGEVSRKSEGDPAAVGLVPIVRRPTRAMEDRPRSSGAGLRLSFAGATMDVEAGFDTATLRTILQVARSMHEEQP